MLLGSYNVFWKSPYCNFMSFSVSFKTAWKVSAFGFLLVHIFLHSDWIWRDNPYTDTFHAVQISQQLTGVFETLTKTLWWANLSLLIASKSNPQRTCYLFFRMWTHTSILELTVSVCQIKRFLKLGIPIYNSKVPEKFGRGKKTKGNWKALRFRSKINELYSLILCTSYCVYFLAEITKHRYNYFQKLWLNNLHIATLLYNRNLLTSVTNLIASMICRHYP